MKILPYLLFFIVAIIHVNAQTNFPGKYPIVLLDKEVTIKPLTPELQRYGYAGFYKDPEGSSVYGCCSHFNSKYNSLVNKKYKVSSVDPYTDADGNKKFVLTLEDRLKVPIYFYYDPKDETNFPFEVTGGLDIPLSFYCIDINYKADVNSGDTIYYSDPEEQIIFTKATGKQGSNYYLKVFGLSADAFTPGKGVTIFLEEGKQVKKPSEIIKVEALKAADNSVNSYMYSAYIILEESDIALLKQYPVKEVKMNFLTFQTMNGVRFMNYLRCLLK